MKKVSIDIAERKGSDFRRSLRSAERLSDWATALGLRFLNTPCSRSSASLFAVTRFDHRRDFGVLDEPERTEERCCAMRDNRCNGRAAFDINGA
jgi:hypothetical protein